ncbi:MAG: PucR family transcriptional regulator ligand-binding domain-containing protein [Lachnospiraceae bacterium]|nr:PucR family transcriptional regulator ligand-binding domain-containing protein [Lachnospiraceae bacterium]
MGVILEELIRQIDSRNIKNIAGSKGLTNLVEWAHMVENVEIASFLTGGEIAFTTGIGIKEDMTLLDLVTAVYTQGAAGMIINVGPYIEKIGHDIISFGERHDFPIFEVPWNVHMADIIRMFCETITRYDQRSMELSAAFKNAIFSPKMEELYLPVLMQKGYFSEWNYTVVVIDICSYVEKDAKYYDYAPISTERFAVVQKIIEKKVLRMKYDAVLYRDQEKLLIIFSDTDEAQACEMIGRLEEQMSSYLKSNEVYFSAVGKTARQIREIFRSYIVAHRIAELLKLDGADNTTKSYSQMGIAQMLLNLNQLDSLEDYYADTIGPLDDYDEANNGNLVETLTCYMYHNGSVQDTAVEMYVHRNTINYKLKKIESILNMTLMDFDVRNKLMTGLLVRKMRHLK